jgi:hypothetical protein
MVKEFANFVFHIAGERTVACKQNREAPKECEHPKSTPEQVH